MTVQSIQASDAVVKASSAEIRGQFTVGSSLSLETVSAYVTNLPSWVIDILIFRQTNQRRHPTL